MNSFAKILAFISIALYSQVALATSIIPRAAPVDQLTGYGAGTTGGGSAAPIIVTTCAALTTAVGSATPAVIRISTVIANCGVIDIKSNKTILGVGKTAGMSKGGFRIRRSQNVIIRNLKFTTPMEKDDILALDNAVQVWIDHNEFSSAGIVGDKDLYDGLLDVSHASDFVTISWNKFSDHWKGSLVGHSDNNASEDTGHLRVTYHHNTFTNVNSRLPSIRFGTGHVYNNVYTNVPTSGINSRMGANVLAESNIFNNVTLAIVTDLDSDIEGFATDLNNIKTGNVTTRITQTSSYKPPYTYTLDTTAALPSIIASAGVGIIG